MTLSRRQFLGWGLTGAGLAAAGGAGLWWANTTGAGTGGSAFTEPPQLFSNDGLLELELEAAPTSVRISGRDAFVQSYNGSLPGPTLQVRPGDVLRVRLTNRLDAPTNLHVHGLHVSPSGNGDNPFVTVNPKDVFDYELRLPEDHPPGTYWYHPHHHGQVADQLAAGLYGAIVVQDPVLVPATRERVLVISDLSLDASGNLAQVSAMERMMGREGELVLVNGQVRPRVAAAPGERERWRIVNACPARYLRLTLAGQQVRLLSRDFARLSDPVQITDVQLAPGNRVELLVDTQSGVSTLTSTPVDRGAMPGMMGGQQPNNGDPSLQLLDLEVTGDSAAGQASVPTAPAPRDLRTEPITGRRTLDFAMGGGMGGRRMGGGRGNGAGMMAFTINGREFDPNRLDSPVQAGRIEEWTLTNSSPMDHPVHLHVWPMQVVQHRDLDLTEPLWLDVVNVPAFSQVTVRIPFEDFTGRTVYHCHILDHEDLGMMGTVEAR